MRNHCNWYGRYYETAVNKSVKFISSDESIATVDAEGRVTALSSGTVTITAMAADGAGTSSTCVVKVYGTFECLIVQNGRQQLLPGK